MKLFRKIKNWLIKKLGGYTAAEMDMQREETEKAREERFVKARPESAVIELARFPHWDGLSKKEKIERAKPQIITQLGKIAESRAEYIFSVNGFLIAEVTFLDE